MNHEKAVQTLVDYGLLAEFDSGAAVGALDQPNVEPTYPEWAAALAKVGLIATESTVEAAQVMQAAESKEAQAHPEGFDEGLANAGLL